MRNTKHVPFPTRPSALRKTRRHAVHKINPAGTKVGKQIQKARGVPKNERGGVVFAGYAAKVPA